MTVINAHNLSEHLPDKIDAFICCISFEKRSTFFTNFISNKQIRSLYVCEHIEFSKNIRENLQVLKDTYKNKINHLKISNSNPLLTADMLVKAYKEIISTKKSPSIVVDITTFPRETLLILFKMLAGQKNIYYIYNSAKSMNYSWLSKGVKAFRSVLGYPGEFSINRKLHLVILLGFELDRAREIIEQYEPNLLSVGVGSKAESISDEFSLMNKNFMHELESYYGINIKHFDISLRDPSRTCHNIISHLNHYSDKHNIVIAPLNNKISTLGAGMAAIANPEIQICYTEMEAYNFNNYSEPADQYYILNITDYSCNNNS